MSQLVIHQFPCLADNYGVLVHDAASGLTAAIDAPDAAAIERELKAHGWRLTHILTTHHHNDHTAGNVPLKSATGAQVIGPAAEAARIPGLDQAVRQGDTVSFGSREIRVLDTPGHTNGHISYWVPENQVAFVGDTLFAMGCGRVLEGSHEIMWSSLQKIAALPDQTEIYCGHEYTVANARFALSVDPDNGALRERAEECQALRAAGMPTLPTRIDKERATNPFLRAGTEAMKARLGLPGAPDWQSFAELRQRKNRFG